MIFVIVGRSGSGKSSIERAICSKRSDLKRIISDTTRPIRDGEVNGIDYHFIGKETFVKNVVKGCYVEYTSYNDWYYGINTERFNIKDGHYICVTNPTGYEQLKNKFKDQVVGIVIHSNDKDRLLNYLHREENPDCYECCRRYLADCEDFHAIEQDNSLYHVHNNMGYLQTTIKTILEIIDRKV